MTDDDLSQIKVEVTHEALIRHWSRLRKWIDENRANYKLLEDLNDDAQKWDACGRADNMLPRWNVRLEEAMALFQQPQFTQNK